MDKIDNKDRPAFGHGNMEQGGAEGLSKREYFAAVAMHGILASSPQNPSNGAPEYGGQLVSELAIDYADQLLTQLEQQP